MSVRTTHYDTIDTNYESKKDARTRAKRGIHILSATLFCHYDNYEEEWLQTTVGFPSMHAGFLIAYPGTFKLRTCTF